VSIAYQLPQSVIVDGAYDLLLQQQPGVPPGGVGVVMAGASGPLSNSRLPNASGRHAHWRMQMAGDIPHLEEAPLPSGVPGGCNQPLVEATPIAPPVALEIPSAHIDAEVVDLGIDQDGQMEAPPTPEVVGWYRMSARAGQPGNTVMSGHIDWGGKTAVFWGLRNLVPGDRIEVEGADGVSHVYTVEWNESFPTDEVPVGRVIGGSYDSLLTLITCDGTYDQVHRLYSERRVVQARLVTEAIDRGN
jgi:sortase (surface protein transpeptidase)